MKKNLFKTMFFCSVGLMICSLCGCDNCGCTKKCSKSCTCPADKKQISERKSMPQEKGLRSEIIKEGEGETPKTGQTVVVHYTGWLDEGGKPGKKFDSSIDRGQKFAFVIGVGQVIPGWDKGVIEMKKGEKRMLYIPADMAYGARGAGAVIPPNADLIFEVELFDIR